MLNGTILRKYRESDLLNVVEVYRESVMSIGPEQYNEDQVKVWSSFPDDFDDFNNLLYSGHTYIAEFNNKLISFGTLNPIDHIAFIYTLGNYSKKGIASSIYFKLEQIAIQNGVFEIYTEASKIAKSFFVKVGFEIAEKEIAIRKELEFERYKMIKKLR